MASLLRKAARMNLVAMDFVLRVTVVELVLGNLDAGRMLSFELSRGSKVCVWAAIVFLLCVFALRVLLHVVARCWWCAGIR